MESLVCKDCGKISPATPSTRHIRCHGCQRLLSIASSSDDGAWTMGQSLIHQTRNTPQLRGSRGFCGGFKSIFRSTNHPQNIQTWTPAPIAMSAFPPRGKRALICGVSYKKRKCELKGVAQDVRNMTQLLLNEYGFPRDSILVLAEEASCLHPTRKNIEDAFKWLTRGTQAGDSLVFYFSGHGKRQRDLNGDEIDGFDETICPMDYETNGMILDNDINDAIVRPLTKGVKLHAIIDSCHSGTVLDLARVFNNTTGKWDDNSSPSRVYKGTSGGMAICFSACEDYQLAADTSAYSPDKEMTGAMTTTFIQSIKAASTKKEKITYQGILNSMHQTLKQAQKSGRLSASIRRIFHRRILQDPQLSASEEFSTSTEFKL